MSANAREKNRQILLQSVQEIGRARATAVDLARQQLRHAGALLMVERRTRALFGLPEPQTSALERLEGVEGAAELMEEANRLSERCKELEGDLSRVKGERDAWAEQASNAPEDTEVLDALGKATAELEASRARCAELEADLAEARAVGPERQRLVALHVALVRIGKLEKMTKTAVRQIIADAGVDIEAPIEGGEEGDDGAE